MSKISAETFPASQTLTPLNLDVSIKCSFELYENLLRPDRLLGFIHRDGLYEVRKFLSISKFCLTTTTVPGLLLSTENSTRTERSACPAGEISTPRRLQELFLFVVLGRSSVAASSLRWCKDGSQRNYGEVGVISAAEFRSAECLRANFRNFTSCLYAVCANSVRPRKANNLDDIAARDTIGARRLCGKATEWVEIPSSRECTLH